jgi:hypothetical protein
MKNDIEVVVSFDTTGSMYPCITQVRREVTSFIKRLFKEVPDLRIGVCSHGDYCDARSTYVFKKHELSTDQQDLVNFVNNCGNTYGGDAPECYELVLHEARNFNWSSDKHKVLILIGDDVPHGPSERQNIDYNKGVGLDWRNELKCLLDMGVKVYGVQALNRSHADSFYNEIAKITGGFRLELNQFSDTIDLIEAICYQQVGQDAVDTFVKSKVDSGKANRTMVLNFTILTGKEVEFKSTEMKKRFYAKDLDAVPAGRFQVLHVDEDCSIKEFVEDQGLRFKTGRGFYEFTKSTKIQDYKEVILEDKLTGDFFCGNKAREICGLPTGSGTVTFCPGKLTSDKYRVFVQSTSYNRKLIGGTKFLYEIEDWS